jgi:probable HAF family extracellular repeat protein
MRDSVKSRRAILITINVLLLGIALALPFQLAAQHTRYKLIDIGTLGGPASYFTDPGIGGVSKVLNNQGMLAGKANTSTPDPSCGLNCFMTHVFRWDKGVLSDLGTLPSGDNSDIGGINSRGWVVGGSETAGIDPFTNGPAFHATLWMGNQPIDLGTLGGYNSNAVHVDDGGQIVGFSTTGTPDPLSFLGESIIPFVWQNGVMRDLGTLQQGTIALPSNQCGNGRNGLVAGFSFISSVVNPDTGVPTAHDFFWHDGIMEDIPTLGGTLVGGEIDFAGYPTACVNSLGQVAGESTVSDDPFIIHPYLYDHGVLTDLGTLGGSFGLVGWLNDAGDIVGGASTANDESFHATLWTKGVIHDLGALDGDCGGRASAINARGQIVGSSYSCDDIGRAVLWDKGSIVDLNAAVAGEPSLQLIEADNINDRGEIAGRGLPSGCDDLLACGHAYLLIPCDSITTCEAETGVTVNRGKVAVIRTSTISNPRSPMERLAAWRAQLSQRNHIPALPIGKLR